MVYGRGAKGGKGRCYNFWAEFARCAELHGKYKLNQCHQQQQDYMECLHHTKLVDRLNTIERQKKALIKEGKWPSK